MVFLNAETGALIMVGVFFIAFILLPFLILLSVSIYNFRKGNKKKGREFFKFSFYYLLVWIGLYLIMLIQGYFMSINN